MRRSLSSSATAVRRRVRRSRSSAPISPACNRTTALTAIATLRYASQKVGSLKWITASAGTSASAMPQRRAWRQSSSSRVGALSGSASDPSGNPREELVRDLRALPSHALEARNHAAHDPGADERSVGAVYGCARRLGDPLRSVARSEQLVSPVCEVPRREHDAVWTHLGEALLELGRGQAREVFDRHPRCERCELVVHLIGLLAAWSLAPVG